MMKTIGMNSLRIKMFRLRRGSHRLDSRREGNLFNQIQSKNLFNNKIAA
jgi:hypothetical protein